MATPSNDPIPAATAVATKPRGVVRNILLGLGISLLLLCVLPVLVVGIFIGGGPFTRIAYGYTFTDLVALPEASLLPPGAQFLTTPGGRDGLRSWPVEQHDSYDLRIFGTNQRSADVLAFYAANLPARGWRRCPTYINEPNPSGWCRDNLQLTVGAANYLSRDQAQAYASQFSTVLELRIVARRRLMKLTIRPVGELFGAASGHDIGRF